MHALTAIGLCLAGVAILVGLLDRWCRPVRMHQLTRFRGNAVAVETYEARRDAGGHGACRNVKEVVNG